jgi:hypothetical protein
MKTEPTAAEHNAVLIAKSTDEQLLIDFYAATNDMDTSAKRSMADHGKKMKSWCPACQENLRVLSALRQMIGDELDRRDVIGKALKRVRIEVPATAVKH